jgi:hypothetical protein
MWICRKSVGSQSGVSQESVRSQSGVSQESVRSQSGVSQESVRSQSGVRHESVRSLSEVFLESDGNQIWRADLNSSPNETWCHVQSLLLGLMWVCWKSVGSQSGVSQESVRSQSGVSQESDMSLSGVCQKSVWSLMVTKFGELIWTALQMRPGVMSNLCCWV